jgi:hypothetical protein
MTALALPLPPDIWEALRAEGRGLILALQAQVVVLQTEVAALPAQCREQTRLAQDSSNGTVAPSLLPAQQGS